MIVALFDQLKGLRSTFSFLGYLPIVLILNLHFPTVGPFYETLPPALPLLLLYFHFVKPSTICCRVLLNSVDQRYINNFISLV